MRGIIARDWRLEGRAGTHLVVVIDYSEVLA